MLAKLIRELLSLVTAKSDLDMYIKARPHNIIFDEFKIQTMARFTENIIILLAERSDTLIAKA